MPEFLTKMDATQIFPAGNQAQHAYDGVSNEGGNSKSNHATRNHLVNDVKHTHGSPLVHDSL